MEPLNVLAIGAGRSSLRMGVGKGARVVVGTTAPPA